MGMQNNMVPYDRRCARSRSPATPPPKRKMDSPVSNWKLGETIEAENGLRFAPLLGEGGQVILTLSGIAPFEPSSWCETSIKNLDLRLDGPTEGKLSCMQACIAEKFTLPKYADNTFKHFLHKNGDYPANIQFKLPKGLVGTRYWDKDKKMTKAPVHFAGGNFEAKIVMKGVYYCEDCWGVSLHATDIMLHTPAPPPECPF